MSGWQMYTATECPYIRILTEWISYIRLIVILKSYVILHIKTAVCFVVVFLCIVFVIMHNLPEDAHTMSPTRHHSLVQ
jgi:hypothetical protein